MNKLRGESGCLKVVAEACATIADQVQDPTDKTPYTFKRVSSRGHYGFRYTAERYIDGVLCEITVRTIPLSKNGERVLELQPHEVAELKAVPQ
jgi:hypothetical protein